MSTLSPARSVTDEAVDWTVASEFTVRSSPVVVDGDSVCACRSMAAGAVMSALTVSGLALLTFTLAPVPAAVIDSVSVGPGSPAAVP